MINFRQPEYRTSSLTAILSIAILIAALVALLMPKPSSAAAAKGRMRSKRDLQREIQRTTADTKSLVISNQRQLWQGNPQEITSMVLKELTDETNHLNLKLTAFRPQRILPLAGIVELPYSAHITGDYPAVKAVLAQLDARKSRVSLRSVQIASSDESSSLVTAAVSLSAYVPASEVSASDTQPGGGA